MNINNEPKHRKKKMTEDPDDYTRYKLLNKKPRAAINRVLSGFCDQCGDRYNKLQFCERCEEDGMD